MTTNEVALQLEYAKLQLAAEAMFGVKHVDVAGKKVALQIEEVWLTDGNDHSSRFTQPQADDFVKNWALVEHEANSSTGFSGTLFKYIGPPNSDLGLTPNQLVISFRSTEFIEDSARDNQATNTLEVSEKGWAFGQISDMEKWYAELKQRYANEFNASAGQVLFQGGAKVLIENGMRSNTVGSVEMPDGTDMTLAEFLRSTLVDSVNLGTDGTSRSLAGGNDTCAWNGGGITIALSQGDGVDAPIRGVRAVSIPSGAWIDWCAPGTRN